MAIIIMTSPRFSRKVFSELEKACLQELIVKYKLNSTLKTIGARKIAWEMLTEEYNAIETNCNKTEAQLRKCWDNMKTRSKNASILEKIKRMETAGDQLILNSSSSSTSDILIEQAGLEVKIEVDTYDPEGENNTMPDFSFQKCQDPIIGEEIQSRVINYDEYGQQDCQTGMINYEGDKQLECQNQVINYRDNEHQECQTLMRNYNIDERQDCQSQSLNYSEATTNKEGKKCFKEIKSPLTINDKEEQMHRLKIAEQKFLVKAAGEIYKMNVLKRIEAEELLQHNRAKRAKEAKEINF